MSKSSLLALPFAAAMLFASYLSPVLAQGKSGTDASRADPADPSVRVPPLVFQPSFAAYQVFSEQEVKDWRESNDNVGRIGGWRAYAQEGRKPEAKPPAVTTSPAAASKSAPAVVKPAAPSKPASSAPAKSGDAPDAHQQHH
jgi:hypothetical protein